MTAANVVPARPEGLRREPLRLDRNERLHPPAELAHALADVPAETLSRYPSAARLETRIAGTWGIEPDRVLATAGGDDGIDRICRLCLRERSGLVTAIPTFEMFPLCARLAGGRVIGVQSLDDPGPLEALLDRVDETTGLVVAITPHNPTGASIDTATLLALADALPAEATLLVDLAYAEFADEDPTVTLLDRGGVLLVRTLSKAWGLAGLRVGYVLGDAEVVEKVREAGPPFPLSGPSLWLAERALRLGGRVTDPYVDAVRSERSRLADALEDLGAEPFLSQANFVLARVPDAPAVWSRLDRAGVRVRRFDHSPELLRFTLPGDPEAFDTLLAALGEALKPGRNG